MKAYITPENLKFWHSGKVRDTALIPGPPKLLLPVASDRISTHNVVHRSLVGGKGELLTAQMIFFALKVFKNVETHLIAFGKRIYDYLPSGEYDPRLHYRALVVERREMAKREFIYRDFLAGSLYRAHYSKGFDPYELELPPGLPLMHRFPQTAFTPTMKSENDEPVPYRKVLAEYPEECRVTGEVFRQGRAHLASCGITLVDFKAEASYGMLADEWLTGDCCRFALATDIQEGREPPWLDKEVFRQEAERQWAGGSRVPLLFGDEAIRRGIARYHEAFERITGMSLARFQKEFLD